MGFLGFFHIPISLFSLLQPFEHKGVVGRLWKGFPGSLTSSYILTMMAVLVAQ